MQSCAAAEKGLKSRRCNKPADLSIGDKHKDVVGLVFPHDFDGLVNDGSEVGGASILHACNDISNFPKIARHVDNVRV